VEKVLLSPPMQTKLEAGLEKAIKFNKYTTDFIKIFKHF